MSRRTSRTVLRMSALISSPLVLAAGLPASFDVPPVAPSPVFDVVASPVLWRFGAGGLSNSLSDIATKKKLEEK